MLSYPSNVSVALLSGIQQSREERRARPERSACVVKEMEKTRSQESRGKQLERSLELLKVCKRLYEVDKMNSAPSQGCFSRSLSATAPDHLDIPHLSKRSSYKYIQNCLDALRKNIHNLFLRQTRMQAVVL